VGLPTSGEKFAELIEYLRKSQEACATLAHLCRDESKLQAQGWIAVSEMLKLTITNVTKLAMRKFQ